MIVKNNKVEIGNSIYVSGSLKDKVVDCYREKITFYDDYKMFYWGVSVYYSGSFKKAFDSSFMEQLIRKQEDYIATLSCQVYERIMALQLQNVESKKLINILKYTLNTKRKITVALLETFLKKIEQIESYSNKEIQEILMDKFLSNYITTILILSNTRSYTQFEVDLWMKTLYEGSELSWYHIQKEKEKMGYYLIENPSKEIQNLTELGAFVAPHRLATALNSLNERKVNPSYLPIYFLLKDETRAQKFLDLLIQKEEAIQTCQIPGNLLRACESMKKR